MRDGDFVHSSPHGFLTLEVRIRMMIDPQLNPLIVIPVLAALLILFVMLFRTGQDGRLQWAVLLVLVAAVVFFFLSRTPLF